MVFFLAARAARFGRSPFAFGPRIGAAGGSGLQRAPPVFAPRWKTGHKGRTIEPEAEAKRPERSQNTYGKGAGRRPELTLGRGGRRSRKRSVSERQAPPAEAARGRDEGRCSSRNSRPMSCGRSPLPCWRSWRLLRRSRRLGEARSERRRVRR